MEFGSFFMVFTHIIFGMQKMRNVTRNFSRLFLFSKKGWHFSLCGTFEERTELPRRLSSPSSTHHTPYILESKLLQAVFRPRYAQSATIDPIRFEVNPFRIDLNYCKGNDGLGIYDKVWGDLGAGLGNNYSSWSMIYQALLNDLTTIFTRCADGKR